jgi:hypothetical protein
MIHLTPGVLPLLFAGPQLGRLLPLDGGGWVGVLFRAFPDPAISEQHALIQEDGKPLSFA